MFATSVSCSKNGRNETIHGSLSVLDVAYDKFVDWNATHVLEIATIATTREEAEKALADYEAKRKPVQDGTNLAYRALALAATQSDEISLKRALQMASDLVDAIDKIMRDL